MRAGAGRAEIERVLAEAGWSRDRVADALRAFAAVDFPVPVPRPRTRLSARDAFLYLIVFGSLYLSAFYLGNLLFQFVNLAFPDELIEYQEAVYGRIRFATSVLVVAYPVFLYASFRTVRDVAADPGRRASPVRRWLTYLTLAGAAFVIIGDLIFLVHGLLSGELTVRFLLKSAIVAGLAAAVFGYYLWTVRADDEALPP